MIRARRSWLPVAVALLAVLVVLPSTAQDADAATGSWTANCATRIRTSPSTHASVRRVLKPGAVVKVVNVVRGNSWSASCRGQKAGRSWLKITSINGRSAKSLFGRRSVYAAAGLFSAKVILPPPPAPSPTSHLSNCSVRLRATASTTGATSAIIDSDVLVTVAGTVAGTSWAAECGASVAGATWHRITAVGGRSTSSLYGVSAVFAASGLFRAVTSTSGYTEGIDVSKWQGTIDWALVRASGKRFAIAKASEGIGYEDPTYDVNKAGALAQGIKLGAYHFARPGSNNPVVEADWFVDTAGYERGMLIPTLDLEQTGGLGTTALTAWVKAWVERVDERLGVKPMIYVSPNFWRTNMADTRWFAENGYRVLWVAHWGVGSPNAPGGDWAGRSWTFWQYTSNGRVPGIAGRVDLNRYRFETFDAVTY